jgi:hypothetical protein
MNKTIIIAAAFVVIALASGAALAASTLTFGFSVGTTSIVSTSVACSAVSPSLVAPVPSGTTLTSCAVTPTTWTGTITLSDPSLVVAGQTGNTFTLIVGPAALAAGSYSETVTSNP